MEPERYERLARLFAQATDVDPAARSAWLDRVCDDPVLRQQLEEMLQDDQLAETPLDRPLLGDLAPGEWADAERGLVGQQLGAYRLRRVLAAGGMGTVYVAEREHPQRTVAVKVMRRGLASPSMVRRFELEAEVLARLQHPGIAQVLDAGIHTLPETQEPIPWFAMELVPGARPLTVYADEQQLGPRARLELLLQVCAAVQHGHYNGVIHRDLKPANLLVDEAGRPKVIDFGVARSTDADVALTTQRTDVGQILGTLQYMSPEQCAAQPGALDARTDVYALGVVLYELLCGRLPYDVAHVPLHAAVRTIQEDPPTRTAARKANAAEAEAEQQVAALAEVNSFLHDVLVSAAPDVTAGVPLTVEDALRRAVAEMEEGGPRPPRVEAQLRYTVGYTLWRRGLRREAIPHLERALVLWREIQGPAAVDVVHTTRHLALALNDSGRGVEAETLLRELRELCARVHGREHELTARTDHDLVLVLTANRQWTEAERLSLDLLEWHRQQADPSSEGMAAVLHNLALIYEQQGRVQEALDRMRDVVESCRQHYGPSHPNALEAGMSYAGMLNDHGRYEEAERFAREVVEKVAVALPDDVRAQQSAWTCLFMALQGQGRFEEAAPWSLRAMEECRARLGEQDPLSIQAISNHAVFLQKWGKPRDADPLLREALALAETAAFAGEPRPYDLRANLGWNCWLLEDRDQAEEFLGQALAEAQAALPPAHAGVLRIEGMQARLLEQRER